MKDHKFQLQDKNIKRQGGDKRNYVRKISVSKIGKNSGSKGIKIEQRGYHCNKD